MHRTLFSPIQIGSVELKNRIVVAPHGPLMAREGILTDAQGLVVEDFGLSDNLMMIHALDLHGCALVTPRERPADIWHDLTAFEACLDLAAKRFASPRTRVSG